MQIAFFGSSITSAYWNGAATYYRGMIRALARRGHHVTFFEPDAFERQQHRDVDPPPWVRVNVYPGTVAGALWALEQARGMDLVIKASGVGVNDELLERAVLDMRAAATAVIFWDVDAPATIDRVRANAGDPFAALIPRYDAILTYGGGEPVVRGYRALGARDCVPIYNALDPEEHHPVSPEPRFAADLVFLGNRLPDRESRVDEFFFAPAARRPRLAFLLGGSGWGDRDMPASVRHLGHVYTRDHNAINSTARLVLNVSRDSMAAYGFSPATRVFEAAGAGACLVTDAWEGIGQFLEPGSEVLVARSSDEVVHHIDRVTAAEARQIGARARRRMLREHTYAHRAVDFERVVGTAPGALVTVGRSRCTGFEHSRDRAGTPDRRRIVFLGLSITSSWGNGHATTYRSLVRQLDARGHDVLFLERDVPWYRAKRDLPDPPFGHTALYQSLQDLKERFADEIRCADLVVVGSYVPEGIEVGRWVTSHARGATAFYDIDTPVTLSQLESGTCEYLSRALMPAYDLYLSFTGGPILDRLEREWGVSCARPLYCSVDPELYGPKECLQRWALSYMGTYSECRQRGLSRLLIEPALHLGAMRFAVAGAQYPGDLRWPENVERLEHVPPGRHCVFYRASSYTLNVTRRDMVQAGFAPSVRLFEAAACAVPIISDAWSGIDEFFEPGEEILLAESAGRVMEYLTGIDEAERRAIGERARSRVLSAHTAAHRAADLERYAFGTRAAELDTAAGQAHEASPPQA